MAVTPCAIQRYFNFVRCLPASVLDALRNTPFNPILHITNVPIDYILIKLLIERFDISTNSFIIGNRSVNFPPSDISIILGLNVSNKKNIDLTSEEKNVLSLCRRYFGSKKIIYFSEIKESFYKASSENIEDLVKLSLILILCVFLIPNKGQTIDSSYCDMVDDEDMCNGMPWGLIVHNHLMNSIQLCSVMLNSTGQYASPDGCIFALQIWAYEHIPVLGMFRGKVDAIPRYLMYSNLKVRDTSFYRASLSNPKVVLKMNLSDLDCNVKHDNETPRNVDRKIKKKGPIVPRSLAFCKATEKVVETCESFIKEKRTSFPKERNLNEVKIRNKDFVKIRAKDVGMRDVLGGIERKRKLKGNEPSDDIDEFKPSRYVAKDLKSVNVFHRPLHPISDEDRALLELHMNSDIGTTLPSGCSISSLRCLLPTIWLDDEVIWTYCTLLKQRELDYPSRFRSCHFCNPFFVVILRRDQDELSEQLLNMFSPSVLEYKISECEQIFIPLNKPNAHWGLLILNVKEEKIEILDSLQYQEAVYWEEEVNLVVNRMDYLLSECGADAINCSSWVRCFVRNIPLQRNWYDCGVFVLKYMDYLHRGLSLTFDQSDMPYFRQRIAIELIRGKALP